MNNDDTILIKSKDGQLKTVKLDVQSESHQPTASSQQSTIKQLNNDKSMLNVEGGLREQVSSKFKNKAPAFYFSVQDEEEVNKFRNGKSDESRNKKEQLYKITASKIAGESQGILPEQKARLENVILSRLFDIRSLIELKEVLIKDRQRGGVELSKEQVNSLVREIEKEREKLSDLSQDLLTGVNLKPEIRSELEIEKSRKSRILGTRDRSRKSRILGTRDRLQNKEIRNSAYIKTSADRQEIKKDEVPQIRTYLPFKRLISTQEIIPPDKIIKKEQQMAEEALFAKPSFNFDLSQIKREKRTVGPLEELCEIDLNEFRTYSQDAKLRVNKIYDKIKLLEEESIEKKSAGIKAWRSSPLYLEYLRIGEQSLAENRAIGDILSNQNSLRLEEFEAIADLNQELNY